MPTKEQLAVPASNAEQLDPPAETFVSDIGDEEIVGHPETRGVLRGKDLKELVEKRDEADKKSAEGSHKVVAKEEPNQDLAESGEAMPTAVAEAADDGEALKEEQAKDLEPTIEPKGKPKTAKDK